jgi:hypothetical protein
MDSLGEGGMIKTTFKIGPSNTKGFLLLDIGQALVNNI